MPQVRVRVRVGLGLGLANLDEEGVPEQGAVHDKISQPV